MDRPTWVRDGYPTVVPYIMVAGAERVLEFARELFGARVARTDRRPNGSLGHTELVIGDSMVMLADTGGEWPETPAALHIYVRDADETYRRALEMGATSIMEPSDQPHGDRMGGVADEVGNQWWIASVASL